MAKQQEWLKEEMDARAARGEDTGMMANINAIKNITMRVKEEMAKETQALNKKHGNIFDDADAEGEGYG